MSKPDGIKEYIDTVCNQIRWKKARPAVADELEAHILDQRDALLHSGKDRDAATNEAIAEMGDAVAVGTMLDHSYHPRIGWKMLACMLAFLSGSCLLYMLLWRSGTFLDNAILYCVMTALYAAIALPFCLIDFTYYAKIPKILFFALVACFALSGAEISIFWRMDSTATALLPFASLLILFQMRGGGFRKFLRCCVLFVLLPCIGYFIFLYFRFNDSWRTWATDTFIIFVLSCVAMMTICVCCGYFAVDKRKALLTLYIPAIAFMILFLIYSNLVQQYESARYDSAYFPMDSMRQMLQNSVWLGRGHEGPVVASGVNEVTRLIYRLGWLPFLGILAAGAGFYAYLLKQCLRQRSVLGRSLSLMGWAALVIPTALGLLNAVGLMPNTFDIIPFINIETGVFSNIYASMVLGLLCNIFRNGDVVRDHMVKAVA